MSNTLKFTLLADGASDRALLPIVRWTVEQCIGTSVIVEGDFADLRLLRPDRRKTLAQRIELACDLFPCDILVVHRDAEQPVHADDRYEEIARAAQEASFDDAKVVRVVPVRMTEAWLLVDEQAIRTAASNPNGTVPLQMPHLNELEKIDAKPVLFDLLEKASGLSVRRLRRFKHNQARARVANHIKDPSVLRNLSSFQRFENEAREQIQCL